MVRQIIVILGDQLSPANPALRQADPKQDIVFMGEVGGEATYVHHHPQKITLILSAMRHFAQQLRETGWRVQYTQLDDPENHQTLSAEIVKIAAQHKCTKIIVTEPTEWRVIDDMAALPLDVTLVTDDRFFASHVDFETWAQGRKSLRMEYFYREMRKKTGYLMEGGKPVGGQWNYDHDNRKAAPKDVTYPGPLPFVPDDITTDVMRSVKERFSAHFGSLDQFEYAVTRSDALRALDHFITHALPRFGDYQDAMLRDNRYLYHSVLSPYINIGLLSPKEVCDAAALAFKDGHAPINAVEGFIRQILGWREFMRGIYFLQGRDYVNSNALGHDRPLPNVYWGGDSKMMCMTKAVEQTHDTAYAHHIQRLMVTGNYALLAGVDPYQVHEWYLGVYADAFEWVEAPNTIGMSQFADGGIVGSKPYVSSGAYINRMSDYCKSCAYKVTAKTGPDACPFNLLYWHFLMRHRDKFAKNPRMAQMYRTWDRMEADHRASVLKQADVYLDSEVPRITDPLC